MIPILITVSRPSGLGVQLHGSVAANALMIFIPSPVFRSPIALRVLRIDLHSNLKHRRDVTHESSSICGHTTRRLLLASFLRGVSSEGKAHVFLAFRLVAQDAQREFGHCLTWRAGQDFLFLLAHGLLPFLCKSVSRPGGRRLSLAKISKHLSEWELSLFRNSRATYSSARPQVGSPGVHSSNIVTGQSP